MARVAEHLRQHRPLRHRRGYRPRRIRGRERAAAPAPPPDAAGCRYRTQSERPSARHLLGAVVPAPVRRRCDRTDSAAGQSTQRIVVGPDESRGRAAPGSWISRSPTWCGCSPPGDRPEDGRQASPHLSTRRVPDHGNRRRVVCQSGGGEGDAEVACGAVSVNAARRRRSASAGRVVRSTWASGRAPGSPARGRWRR